MTAITCPHCGGALDDQDATDTPPSDSRDGQAFLDPKGIRQMCRDVLGAPDQIATIARREKVRVALRKPGPTTALRRELADPLADTDFLTRVADAATEKAGMAIVRDEHPELLPDGQAALPRPVPMAEVSGEWPEPILSISKCGKRDGAVLSVGTVAILAGAGGSAKSALARHLALTMAAKPAIGDRPCCGGSLIVKGGPVLMVTYEDAPPVTREAGARLVDQETLKGEPMRRMHVLHLPGFPMFGTEGLLRGWDAVWQAVDTLQPKPAMVVIDPVLHAFMASSNDAEPVREFVGKLTCEAAQRRLGVLLVAHSRKAARDRRKKSPTPTTRGRSAAPWRGPTRPAGC